jgi:hypothetical protein
MSKHLSYLEINDSPTLYVDDYLQHLYHPFKIVCQHDDTHHDLFRKLIEMWPDGDKAEAVKEWIAYQRTQEEEKTFAKLIITGWADPPVGEFYAWFDMQDETT